MCKDVPEMYGVTVSMTVRDGQRQAFEKLIKMLIEAVKAHEPQNLAYHVLRSRAQPNHFRIVEIYASKEAFKTHLGAAYVNELNTAIQATLDLPAQMEVVDVVA
jgi:quinol monooxygenase YgiN